MKVSPCYYISNPPLCSVLLSFLVAVFSFIILHFSGVSDSYTCVVLLMPENDKVTIDIDNTN